MKNRAWYGISLAIDGEIAYTLNGKTYISNKNTMIFLPKGASYKLDCYKPGKFALVNFLCDEKFNLDEFLAIPINDAMAIVTSIIEKGYIAKPYIGVSITDVSAETQSYGLPKGAAVKEIVEGSPAEAAGLQVNDIITRADDTEITGSDDLVDFIGARSVGDTVTLSVYRQGETVTVRLEIGEQIKAALPEEPEADAVQTIPQQGDMNSFPFFGFGR